MAALAAQSDDPVLAVQIGRLAGAGGRGRGRGIL